MGTRGKTVIAVGLMGVLAIVGIALWMFVSAVNTISGIDACDGVPMPRPVVVGQTVFAAAWDDQLSALDPTGAQRWKTRLPGAPVELFPNGMGVIVGVEGDEDHQGLRYVALGKDGAMGGRWNSNCSLTPVAGDFWICPSANQVALIDGKTGRQRGSFKITVGDSTRLRGNPQTGSLWISEWSDDWPESGRTLVRLNARTNKRITVKMRHTWVAGLPDDGAIVTAITPVPVKDGESAEDESDSFALELVRLDVQGEATWRHNLGVVDSLGVEHAGRPVISGNQVTAATASGVIALNLDGSESWSIKTDDEYPALVVAGNEWLMLGRKVTRIDESGNVRWSFEQDHCTLDDAFEVAGIVYASGEHNGWGCLFAVKEGSAVWDRVYRGKGEVDAGACEWRNWNGVQPVKDKGVLVSTDGWDLTFLNPAGEVAWSNRADAADPAAGSAMTKHETQQ
jgi:hypothetical protein